MMTEKIAHTKQQNNVEQGALFLDNPATNPITNPNILIGEDLVAQPVKEKTLEEMQREANASEYKEVLLMVENIGMQYVFSNQFADTDEQREKMSADYAQAVEFIGEDLHEGQKEKLARHALAVLKEMPQDEVAKKLVHENRATAQALSQRSKELQATRDDVSEVEKNIRKRRTLLQIKFRDIEDGSELQEELLSEIRFLNSILDRPKVSPKIVDTDIVMPTTDELEARLTHLTPEDVSPPRGITLARMGHAVVDFLVDFPHKVKEAIILDDSILDQNTDQQESALEKVS